MGLKQLSCISQGRHSSWRITPSTAPTTDTGATAAAAAGVGPAAKAPTQLSLGPEEKLPPHHTIVPDIKLSSGEAMTTFFNLLVPRSQEEGAAGDAAQEAAAKPSGQQHTPALDLVTSGPLSHFYGPPRPPIGGLLGSKSASSARLAAAAAVASGNADPGQGAAATSTGSPSSHADSAVDVLAVWHVGVSGQRASAACGGERLGVVALRDVTATGRPLVQPTRMMLKGPAQVGGEGLRG